MGLGDREIAMDIRMIFDGWLLSGDLTAEHHALDTDAGLETAIIISLFSDRRAAATDELPAGHTWRRGWWGAELPDVPGDETQWGSHLWLLSREKQTEETRLRAEQYAREALEWLMEDGAAEDIEVTAKWTATGFLDLRVDVTRPNNTRYAWQWSEAWQAQEEMLNGV